MVIKHYCVYSKHFLIIIVFITNIIYNYIIISKILFGANFINQARIIGGLK